MTLPSFLIIGAAKSGTSSLYQYLKQHPQVYMSPTKETNFFAYEGQSIDIRWWGEPPLTLLRSITDIRTYRAQFRAISNELASGEVSPLYLCHPTAPLRIQHYVPDAKLIAILRHPAERAFSNFMHLIRDNREPFADFSKALQEEKSRMRDGWCWDYYYQNTGFYYPQLKRYFDLFDKAQIQVFLYEDLSMDVTGLTKRIFQFLGVDDSFVPDTSFRFNLSGTPKSRALHYFLNEPNAVKTLIKPFLPQKLRHRLIGLAMNRNLARPKMSVQTRADLIEIYRDDILKLQDLIQLDLSAWLG